MRTCIKCKIEKDESEFRVWKLGITKSCIECLDKNIESIRACRAKKPKNVYTPENVNDRVPWPATTNPLLSVSR